ARSVGQEGPLDGDVLVVVQDPEHGLETQVGHADRVGVGIDQAHRERTARAGREEPALGAETGETIGWLGHRRRCGPYPRVPVASRAGGPGSDAGAHFEGVPPSFVAARRSAPRVVMPPCALSDAVSDSSTAKVPPCARTTTGVFR